MTLTLIKLLRADPWRKIINRKGIDWGSLNSSGNKMSKSQHSLLIYVLFLIAQLDDSITIKSQFLPNICKRDPVIIYQLEKNSINFFLSHFTGVGNFWRSFEDQIVLRLNDDEWNVHDDKTEIICADEIEMFRMDVTV